MNLYQLSYFSTGRISCNFQLKSKNCAIQSYIHNLWIHTITCSRNWRTLKTAGTFIHRHSLIFRLDLFPLHCCRWKGTSVLTLSASMQRKQIVQPWEWSGVHECRPPSSAPMPGALVAHEDLILSFQAGSLNRHLLCIARIMKKKLCSWPPLSSAAMPELQWLS